MCYFNHPRSGKSAGRAAPHAGGMNLTVVSKHTATGLVTAPPVGGVGYARARMWIIMDRGIGGVDMSSKIDPQGTRLLVGAECGRVMQHFRLRCGPTRTPNKLHEWGWLFVYTLIVGSWVNFTYRMGKAHGRDEAQRLASWQFNRLGQS
jgi:hypothetical protein